MAVLRDTVVKLIQALSSLTEEQKTRFLSVYDRMPAELKEAFIQKLHHVASLELKSLREKAAKIGKIKGELEQKAARYNLKLISEEEEKEHQEEMAQADALLNNL